MKRIFIGGPMTGVPDDNFPAFNAAAAHFRALGYHVENPAENPPQGSWEAYMRLSLAQLLQCDEAAFLPRWEHSRGAQVEHYTACQLGIARLYL